jgi:tetrahydromethanopterin S-methyltransferase subunit D
MPKNPEKRQKFIENNRRIANSIGNVFVIIFVLAIVGRIIHSVFLSLQEFITNHVGMENLKAGLFVIGIIFVSYIIASFLFGGGLEDD